MPQKDNFKIFQLSALGETTGERFDGQFEFRLLLTVREKLLKDRMKKELLGVDAQGSNGISLDLAEMVSEFGVSLVKMPSWFTNSQGGLDLFDNNVLIEIYNKMAELREEQRKAISKDGEAARNELKELAKAPTPKPE